MTFRSATRPTFRGQSIIPRFQHPPSAFDGGLSKEHGQRFMSHLRRRLWWNFQSQKKRIVLFVWIILLFVLLVPVRPGATTLLLSSSSLPAKKSSRPSQPRVVVLNEAMQVVSIPTGDANDNASGHRRKYDLISGSLDDDAYFYRYRMISDEEKSKCPLIADWQARTSAFPNCNLLHEVDMRFGDSGQERIEHIDSGGFKAVWSVLRDDDKTQEFVLKTTLYSKDFRPRDLNKHLHDAIIMGEATNSRYVLNMYGYCAHSGLVERASGTLGGWLRKYRRVLSSKDLLQIAIMVAKGVEDMHLYHRGIPTFCHADIKVSQFLRLSDEYPPAFKINDFNRGVFLTSKSPPEICPFTMSNTHRGSTSRSPEEYTDNGEQTDKIDVFSMGSVFYYLLTGHAPFSSEDFKTAITKIKAGVQPPLPEEIGNSTDTNIRAIVSAMKKCRQLNKRDRPFSREVSAMLMDAKT